MNPKFEIKDQSLIVQLQRITARVDISEICIGHFGCKLFGTLKNIPSNISSDLPQGWKSTKDTVLKLSQSLQTTLEISEMKGAVLWDTMRTGSDYWRAGNLLLKTTEMLHSEFQNNISYAREDCLCPPRELLKDFLDDNSSIFFSEYAQCYANYLNEGTKLSVAAASVVMNLALKKIPLFYCIDPYINGYGQRKQFCSDTPYLEREYLKELRTEGCHRIVLVEEIVKFFIKIGVSIRVFELDQSFGKVHDNLYSRNP